MLSRPMLDVSILFCLFLQIEAMEEDHQVKKHPTDFVFIEDFNTLITLNNVIDFVLNSTAYWDLKLFQYLWRTIAFIMD